MIDTGGQFANAGAVIDQEALRARYQATAAKMPDGFTLVGVTFHGPDGHRDWVAFAQRGGVPSAGCEGWGDTPFKALADLLRHVREEP